jgi:hypothetical protein
MSPWAAIVAALAAGIIGTLHCAAMCGPLALACAARPGLAGWRDVGAYLGGRFVSYAGIGAVMGTIGEHALCRLPVSTAQTVAVGLVATAALVRGAGLMLRGRRTEPRPARLRTSARPSLYRRFLARVPRRGVGLGLATGFLPCGMLVPAWLLAASTASVWAGAAVMFAFALASMPGLILPVAGRRLAGGALARVPVRVQGAAWVALGVLVALRPLLAAAHHH